MNWDKARNYTIVFLFALNILLLSINLWIKHNQRLTTDQKQDIINLLQNNGITVSCEIPDRYYSESQLVLRRFNYDYLRLQNIFISNQHKLKRIDAENKVTFSNSDETLTIDGNHIDYRNNAINITDEKKAKKTANDFVKAVNGYFGNFYMYETGENDAEFTFRFVEKISGLKVYNNIITVSVYKSGGLRVGLSYLQPGENYGNKTGVISSDEALFSAMPHILQNETGSGLNITQVELCYYLHQLNTDEGIAIPCYRIVVNYNRVYYINGYTGDLVN